MYCYKAVKSISFILFLHLICYVPAATAAAVPSNKPLVFGFLPVISAEKMIKRFGPLIDYLSRTIGHPVTFESAPNYQSFVKRTNSEKRFDILFTAPHFYYLAHKSAGYSVVVRVAAPSMYSIIVVPETSNIRNLQDLRGKKISVPDQYSLATAMLRAHLQQHDIDPDKDLSLVATPNHSASLLSAHKGITDAASLMLPPFKRAKDEIRNSMRILDKTKGSPHMPISIAPWLDQSQKDNITKALLALNKVPEGKELLQHMSWPGFEPATDEEYQTLKWAAEQINLPTPSTTPQIKHEK